MKIDVLLTEQGEIKKDQAEMKQDQVDTKEKLDYRPLLEKAGSQYERVARAAIGADIAHCSRTRAWVARLLEKSVKQC